jgi:sugar diacid utilization regulator
MYRENDSAPMIATNTRSVTAFLRHALPLDTQVLGGAAGLAREVRWVAVAQPGAPLPYLEGGELLLCPPASESDLRACLAAAREAGVAAVALFQGGGPTKGAHLAPAGTAAGAHPHLPGLAADADDASVPVLLVPPGNRIRDVERAVTAYLLEEQGHAERRSGQLYQQLVGLAAENVGLKEIISALGALVKKGVVVQDKNLRVQYEAVWPPLAAHWAEIRTALTDRRNLPEGLADRHRLPRHTASVVVQRLGNTNAVRLVVPIITKAVGRGYISFLALEEGDSEPFDEIDRLALAHSATVCALEMARAKSISEVEKRVRGEFLTSLLRSAGTVREAEALAEGDRLGHNVSAPHVALVMFWHGSEQPSGRRLETLVNTVLGESRANAINVLSQLEDRELRLFLSSESEEPLKAARALGGRILAAAKAENGEARLAVGIGTVAARPSEWRASYDEALSAADIARKLNEDRPLYSGEMGIYTLLTYPEFHGRLLALRDKMLGPLVRVESAHSDLIHTLEAFFKMHGNYTQTAEQLRVHRNTLFYRMNRIAEITGCDLNNPDVRLAMHLALKIHRLLGQKA